MLFIAPDEQSFKIYELKKQQSRPNSSKKTDAIGFHIKLKGRHTLNFSTKKIVDPFVIPV